MIAVAVLLLGVFLIDSTAQRRRRRQRSAAPLRRASLTLRFISRRRRRQMRTLQRQTLRPLLNKRRSANKDDPRFDVAGRQAHEQDQSNGRVAAHAGRS